MKKRKINFSGLEKFKPYLRYVIVVLLFLFSSSIYNNFSTIKRAKGEVERKRLELESIQKENERLKNEKSIIDTDLYKEIQLRDKLGYAREGEIVVILPDEETLRKIAPDLPHDESELPDPNWKKWLKLFL